MSRYRASLSRQDYISSIQSWRAKINPGAALTYSAGFCEASASGSSLASPRAGGQRQAEQPTDPPALLSEVGKGQRVLVEPEYEHIGERTGIILSDLGRTGG